MSNKLKRKPTKTERENSTWASAVKSFFLEFFLNSEYSPHYSFDENLTKEGKRKKNDPLVVACHCDRGCDRLRSVLLSEYFGSDAEGRSVFADRGSRAHHWRERDDHKA